MQHEKKLYHRDGRVTNRILTALLGPCVDVKQRGYTSIDQAFLEYCRKFNIGPSRHHRSRRYWVVKGRASDVPGQFRIPEELVDRNIFEGVKSQITVNKYERNDKARNACIEFYGYICKVCDFDFEDKYGAIGKQFIHVHHIVSIASIGKSYKVDPKNDLRPVCPNCHAMLHRKNPPYSIDELKKKVSANREAS